MTIANVRHDISHEIVSMQIHKAVATHEAMRERLKADTVKAIAAYAIAKTWSGREPDLAYIDPMIDAWIAKTKDHYALVRVIELPQPGKRFILVYGDTDDETVGTGTGPFESFSAAAQWFIQGGR